MRVLFVWFFLGVGERIVRIARALQVSEFILDEVIQLMSTVERPVSLFWLSIPSQKIVTVQKE
tara:strand:- start:23 stop:211 length:189 start_codon:yes stop_codon:yes gene_type:complete